MAKHESDISAPSASSVTADDRKIAHRGSCHLAKTQGATDVCWAGGDDTPAAFENIGYMSALADATTRTFIDSNPVWVREARLATSREAHPAKPIGLPSAQPHMNEVRAIEWSPDVIFEGRGVVRTDDPTTQNKQNTLGKVDEKPAVAHPAALTDSEILAEARAFLKWANENLEGYKGKLDLTKDPREVLQGDAWLRRKWYDYEQQKERKELHKPSLEILSNGLQRARWVHLAREPAVTLLGVPVWVRTGGQIQELGEDVSVMSHGYEDAVRYHLKDNGWINVDRRYQGLQFGQNGDRGYRREFWDLEDYHSDQNHHLNFYLGNDLQGIADDTPFLTAMLWDAQVLKDDWGNWPDVRLAVEAAPLAQVVADPARSNADVNDYIWSTFGDPTYVDPKAPENRYQGPWCQEERYDPNFCPDPPPRPPPPDVPAVPDVPNLDDPGVVEALIESNVGIPF